MMKNSGKIHDNKKKSCNIRVLSSKQFLKYRIFSGVNHQWCYEGFIAPLSHNP